LQRGVELAHGHTTSPASWATGVPGCRLRIVSRSRWAIRVLSAPLYDGLSSPHAKSSTLDVVDNPQLALSTYLGPGVLRPPEPICGIGLHHAWQLGPLKEVDHRPPAQDNHGRGV
jgi:hypothetical protein